MKTDKKSLIIIIIIAILMCVSIFGIIKLAFFKDQSLITPIASIKEYYNSTGGASNIVATTIRTTSEKTTSILTVESSKTEEELFLPAEDGYDFIRPPKIVDDGSIIYDGMTVTELTEKLNKSLTGDLTNTGYFFAKYTKETGLNPYLAVAIVLLETGCNWKCSTITVECNNIGGLKGHGSCMGSSYSKYDSLEEGITAYLDILYNGYYLQGLDTPEKMNSKYAESTEWANKVNNYINSIKAK